jgi:hypothetical protein
VFTLYEDDGESNAYQNGQFAETTFEISQVEQEFICSIGQTRGTFAGCVSERTIILNIHQQPRVRRVISGGEVIPAVKTAEALEQALPRWFWEPRRQILTIKLSPANKAQAVRVV